MKHLYTIFLITLLPMLSFGQSEYFSTDSTSSYGIKLIDGGDLLNSQLCQVKKGDKILQYTPYEVKEFGFKDGRVYISKEIQIADSSKRVFLERLNKGNTILYYYKGRGIGTFFFQKDSTLFVEIPKLNTVEEDYSKQLSNLTKDCSNISDACKLVSYNKMSLSKFMSRYEQCVLKPFPHFKYGLFVGYEFLRVIPSNEKNVNLGYFDYSYDGGFSLGLFIDNPIFVSDFSLHTEITFSKHGYSYNHISASEDLDLIIDITSLRIPVLIRYSLPINNIRPYFNIGAIFSYNITNENILYQTSFFDNIIEIGTPVEEPIISDNEIGYALGCGLEYNLDYKKAIFFEIRYSNQYGITNNLQNNNSIINISFGINF